ncbi:GNAT family N-acetyltransferase [Vitiosangium sp. GDMCC 1.1324]|uniref:GNAT family N-acetyltransferase n=1 Tax=Vitiosangium sp. (strain GDMCC 1.1324) TaxID=2138576 RepID=UPI000D38E0BF|nr:GNAT family protein [Vitiosangium sp. GDMCC 1.1324]PTL75561.1 GNAT family N-acetyltransferase [Vitiosangium sp. GDMCC 1.1324]
MTQPLRIECGPCALRAFQRGDEASLVRHANNRAVWLNLRDRFPHPYTLADAEGWVRYASGAHPLTDLAIEVSGEAVGGIGMIPGSDIERCSAEVGYWLGESHWGRGITSAALAGFVSWAFEDTSLLRLFALPFVDNVGSRRVLEKTGFVLEGILRHSAVKDGQVRDQAMYARLRP